MKLSRMLERFIKEAPVATMARAILERAFPDKALDELFERTAERQYEDTLLFSTVVKILAMVVCRERKSVRNAYLAVQEEACVSVQALYDKLKKSEPAVAAALVQESHYRLRSVIRRLKTQRPALFRGYRTKILDGSHLTGTQHRIRETRTLHSSPLPAQALAILDPESRMISHVFPWEDAHSQERRILADVLETIQARDLLIGDRNFCTTGFFFALACRGASFIIRQHASTLTDKKLIGERELAGRTDRGTLYEQTLETTDPETGEVLSLRRITLVLKQPTEDGDTEIHLLTNLPKKFRAKQIALAYLERWSIEHAFQELEQAFRGEVDTLGYPKAALLSFSVAVTLYNVISVVKAALQAAHGTEVAAYEDVSVYCLASEIAATHGGMMIALEPEIWTETFASCTDKEFAEFLTATAAHANPQRYRKARRGPKKPPPPRTGGLREKHVSTYRLLQTRKTKSA